MPARVGIPGDSSGGDFGKFQLEKRPAGPANYRAILRHIHGRGIAFDALRGGVGGIGKRVGRYDAAGRSALERGGRLKRSSTVAAHVVEAAVGCASVKYFSRPAHRAGNFELMRLHATASRSRRTPGPA